MERDAIVVSERAAQGDAADESQNGEGDVAVEPCDGPDFPHDRLAVWSRRKSFAESY